MAIKKTKKKEILDKVSVIAKGATSAVFVNFHGLTVANATELRRTLKGAGVGYTVAKKTLAKKAFTERGFKGDMPTLDGELAIAFMSAGASTKESNDVTAPAREVHEFEKKFEGKIAILGGVFEDKFMSKEEMTALALIPSKQTLYGMFVNLINSPLQRLAIVTSEIAKKKTA